MRIAVAGKLEFNYGFKRMTNPYLEVLDGEGAAEGMIIPVHPACEKISAAWMPTASWETRWRPYAGCMIRCRSSCVRSTA